MEKTTNKNKIYTGIGITAGLLLLGNTYFYVDNNKLKEENQKHIYQVNSLTTSNTSLEKSIITKTEELAKLTAEKLGLQNLLETTNKSLEESRGKVIVLIKENKALNHFRKEVIELRKLKNQYQNQISELQTKVFNLAAEVTGLRNENSTLKQRVEELQLINGVLGRKVELGSIVKAESIFGEGQKELKNDKFVKVLRAKKTDRLSVTFDLADNKVAEAGKKNIYVRFIDPRGKVIFNEANNSGTFTNVETNKVMDYSAMKTVDYKNEKQKINVVYTPTSEVLTKGEYKVEFYSDGYFAGSSKFNLK